MHRAVLILALTAACYEPPDYRRTHFACKRSSLCPSGLVCSEDHCVEPPNDMLLVEPEPLFLITRDEATQGDYARCVADVRCPGPASLQVPDAPIRGLSADAADAYCRYRQMRLPTDEEWRAAELIGVARGDGVRCARSVE